MEATFHEKKTFDKIVHTGREVHNKVFEECIFTQCDFSESSFAKSRFMDCFFIDCNLTMAGLRNCGMQNISFRECKLLGVNFSECEDFLFGVRFESCVLDYASFMDKKMPKTPFRHVSLKNAVFIKTDLTGCIFEEADLEGAVFDETKLEGADLTGAFHYDIDPTRNRVRKARFSMQGLPGLLHRFDIRIA